MSCILSAIVICWEKSILSAKKKVTIQVSCVEKGGLLLVCTKGILIKELRRKKVKLVHLDGAQIPYLNIQEYNDVYVSNYSDLLINSLPSSLDGKIVCDYGSGTGVITLCSCAKGANKVIAIEIDKRYRELTEKNIADNVNPRIVELYASAKEFMDASACFFDYIFCNPASLPSIVGDDSFYNGGEFGLDMILEVVNFTNGRLTKNGHLIILITSIIPTSIFHDELQKLNLKCSVLNFADFRFREHYKNIKSWVDDNQSDYPEMLYIENSGFLFEKVIVYDVQRM